MSADPPVPVSVTRLLEDARQGDDSARDRLFQAVYTELETIARRHMRNERANHTLEPAALVNEVALRLLGAEPLGFQNRTHFLSAASLAMRRVLVDHARARHAVKRDGGVQVTLHDVVEGRQTDVVDAIALDQALNRLAQAEPRWAQVVEMRFLLGLEVSEVAQVLGVSEPTIKRDWRFARAWLARELQLTGPAEGGDESPAHGE